ncbi:MAG: winged helix-turn-helix domain-containing protein, partial [Chthoniobacteraceae bacterium]
MSRFAHRRLPSTLASLDQVDSRARTRGLHRPGGEGRVPNVLAVMPGVPSELCGRSILGEGFVMDILNTESERVSAAQTHSYDLLAIVTGDVDEQQRIACAFQRVRRWRLVPVLYVSDEGQQGFSVPGTFRPEIDSLARGTLTTSTVERRIKEMAREGVAAAELVVAGVYELDKLRGRLRFRESEIALTERESEIVSMLLLHSGQTVAASEIIERGWGAMPDDRYFRILRRHVSNIRRK